MNNEGAKMVTWETLKKELDKENRADDEDNGCPSGYLTITFRTLKRILRGFGLIEKEKVMK